MTLAGAEGSAPAFTAALPPPVERFQWVATLFTAAPIYHMLYVKKANDGGVLELTGAPHAYETPARHRQSPGLRHCGPKAKQSMARGWRRRCTEDANRSAARASF
jgi:hypothetical protein